MVSVHSSKILTKTVSMWVYVYVYKCTVCVCVWMLFICACVDAVYVYVYGCWVYVSMCVCECSVCVCLYLCINSIYIYIYIYIYILCVYLCINAIYTYTYTHYICVRIYISIYHMCGDQRTMWGIVLPLHLVWVWGRVSCLPVSTRLVGSWGSQGVPCLHHLWSCRCAGTSGICCSIQRLCEFWEAELKSVHLGIKSLSHLASPDF